MFQSISDSDNPLVLFSPEPDSPQIIAPWMDVVQIKRDIRYCKDNGLHQIGCKEYPTRGTHVLNNMEIQEQQECIRSAIG